MFAEEARRTRSGRRSIAFASRGKLRTDEAPTLRIKIRTVMPPPALADDQAADNMDASLFVTAWDMEGLSAADLAQEASDLLPLGFDLYAVGLQGCTSVPEAVDRCLAHLSADGARYVEFSHLISGKSGAGASLALAVFARRSLVESEAVSMSCVGMVRDRKLSMMPLLRSGGALALAHPQAARDDDRAFAPLRSADNQQQKKQRQSTMNTGAGLGPEGGAVTMRFDFFDSNILFVNVRESCVGELNEILARVEPECHAHVFLFGDFGADVLDTGDELLQRLYLESFDAMPQRFRSQRRMVLTRAQDDAVRPYLVPRLHGHYDLLLAAEAAARGAKPPPPAPFSTFRLYGGAGIDRAEMPGPPRFSLARSLRGGRGGRSDGLLGGSRGGLARRDEEEDDEEEEDWDREVPPPPYRDSVASMASRQSRAGRRVRLDDLADAAAARAEASGGTCGSSVGSKPSRASSSRASLGKRASMTLGKRASARKSATGQSASGSNALRRAIESLRLGLSPVQPTPIVGAKQDALQSELRLRQEDIRRRQQERLEAQKHAADEDAPLHTCSVCGRGILLPGDCFTFMERTFHRGCVRCDDCGCAMSGQFFVVADRMLCQASYAKLYVDTCAGCKKPADARDQLIKASGDRTFHVGCFRCAECGEALASIAGGSGELEAQEFVFADDGRLLCGEHGSKHSCGACGKAAAARDAVQVDVKGDGAQQVFHSRCFRCADCARPIAECGGIFVTDGDDVLCRADYDKRRAARSVRT